MMKYEAVIGIEMHAELNTRTKAFCACQTEYGAPVNTHICPSCTGMPGALPTLNSKMVEYAIRMGLACGCSIHRETKHDRKNYFYPDLPRAYQISQYDIPLCYDGELSFYVGEERRSVRIGRIHIEEDTAKLLHDDRFSGTLIDFNRCGVPLIEIVSHPDLRSAEETRSYLEALKSVLECLGICNCRMEQGNIRCDVNVSVRPEGQQELGHRVEMKNINTFSGAERACEFEIARQIAQLEAGNQVEVETRRWDDDRGESFAMRSKEGAQDYRYFPEPDLVSIRLDSQYIEDIRATLPELPIAKYERYLNRCGLSPADSALLSADLDRASFYDACLAVDAALAKPICNWLLGELSRLANERNMAVSDLGVDPKALVELIVLQQDGKLSSTAAKTVFEHMLTQGDAPIAIMERLGLAQINDADQLIEIVRQVIADQGGPVADYRGGKTNVLGFLVGQCMKKSGGKGNPQTFRQLLDEQLSGKSES